MGIVVRHSGQPSFLLCGLELSQVKLLKSL
jgi:hypothetical protein